MVDVAVISQHALNVVKEIRRELEVGAPLVIMPRLMCGIIWVNFNWRMDVQVAAQNGKSA
jgi:hypothetical protein